MCNEQSYINNIIYTNLVKPFTILLFTTIYIPLQMSYDILSYDKK